jgi:hypothetical protein
MPKKKDRDKKNIILPPVAQYSSTRKHFMNMAKTRKKLSFDALLRTEAQNPSQRDGAPVLISNESSLLSADDEDRAAALLRQLDFEEALLEALASDLRLSLTPTGTPCKEVRASI